jgi:hypothetical protein
VPATARLPERPSRMRQRGLNARVETLFAASRVRFMDLKRLLGLLIVRERFAKSQDFRGMRVASDRRAAGETVGPGRETAK